MELLTLTFEGTQLAVVRDTNNITHCLINGMSVYPSTAIKPVYRALLNVLKAELERK